MSLFIKLFNTTAEYNTYTADTANFILPNVSCAMDDLTTMYYNPNPCEEETIYELVGEPSYPTEIDGSSASFNMTFNYKRTDIDIKCSRTFTYGSDTVTVEVGTNPSTSSPRTVEGTYDYHGLEIEYSIIQTKSEPVCITAKYNVTSTSSPTPIGYNQYISGFSKIEIDGVEQPSVVSAYTFSTTGEHTVKYISTDPTSIGDSVLERCASLTSCIIGSDVTSIGSWAFASCTSLTSIDIPSGVTSIGNYAFRSCTGLTSCTIGNGVTSIGNSAFNGCYSLTSVTIGSGVTSIGESAFESCYNLTNIVVDSNNTIYDSRNNCNAIIETDTNTLILGCQNTIIPNSVTSIGMGAFAGCYSLTSITIPNSVTSIGRSAFSMCSGLTSITIPNSVTSIDYWAFQDCTNLTSINIPSGVTNIRDGVFRYCTSLTSITIPDNVVSIGWTAFANCNSLTSITIPNSVTSISEQAFAYCENLTSVTIGSGVTSIGESVFYACTSLISVTVNTTTPPTLGTNAFDFNASGRKIYVPSASVNAYKAAAKWSYYASDILPIS